MWIYCHEKLNVDEIQDKDKTMLIRKKKKGEDELI